MESSPNLLACCIECERGMAALFSSPSSYTSRGAARNPASAPTPVPRAEADLSVGMADTACCGVVCFCFARELRVFAFEGEGNKKGEIQRGEGNSLSSEFRAGGKSQNFKAFHFGESKFCRNPQRLVTQGNGTPNRRRLNPAQLLLPSLHGMEGRPLTRCCWA